MSTYVIKNEKEKAQEAEDRKIDSRYRWFIFMFIVVLGLSILVLALSYFNGAFGSEGFFGLDGVVKNIVWVVFTALFIFWALLLSIIRVREAYYEAEDYHAFSKLSVLQFFYLWSALLILLFVVVTAAVMFIFPGSTNPENNDTMDSAFAINQNTWLGVSPFFVFYLLAFFSYCYLVFMLSFGYIKDLDIFDMSKREGSRSRQIKNIEKNITKILEQLENLTATNPVTGYSDETRKTFVGVESNPVPAVPAPNANALKTVTNGSRRTTGAEYARLLAYPQSRQTKNPVVPNQPLAKNTPAAQQNPSLAHSGVPIMRDPSFMPGRSMNQSRSMYPESSGNQRLPHTNDMPHNPAMMSGTAAAGSGLPQGQTMPQAPAHNSFVPPGTPNRAPLNNQFDPRLNYLQQPTRNPQEANYYDVSYNNNGISKTSQDWLTNSLNSLSLPQPVRGVNNAVVGQAQNFGMPANMPGNDPNSSWNQLLEADAMGSLRGRRRTR